MYGRFFVSLQSMKKTQIPTFDFSEVPPSWQLCFCDECPRQDECLHFLAGQYAPDNLTWGPAIYPSAYKKGDCMHFKETKVIRAAYGFKPLFAEVKQKDYQKLRSQMMKYLGSYRTYYRYNSGERKLTPEQQEHIIGFFHRLGYTDELQFAHYQDVIDFT